MPMETKIIKDFPKCPDCGSEEKISELGCAEFKEKGKIPKDAFTSLGQEIVPLEQPMMAGVTVSGILSRWDICGGCGRKRYTRSEVIQVPVTAQPQQQQVFRNNPGQRGGFRS